MNQSRRSSAVRRLIRLLLFVAVACAYTMVAIRTLLRSEQIRTIGPDSDWSLAEKVVAFPAFYLSADPLTGLLINAMVWGLALAMLLPLLWPQSKHRDRDRGARD